MGGRSPKKPVGIGLNTCRTHLKPFAAMEPSEEQVQENSGLSQLGRDRCTSHVKEQ